jgi:23S rRNA (cytidine2498-2'-O)-methyltransferase
MMNLLFYCRSGYETDLLSELEQKCAQMGLYGYAKLTKNSALLRFVLPQTSSPQKDISPQDFFKAIAKIKTPRLQDLVFARQKLTVLADINLNTDNRVTSVIECLTPFTQAGGSPTFSDVFVEHADTEEGKEIAKFCKKFVVPLRSALRKNGLLTKESSKALPFLHLFFENSQQCTLAFSAVNDRSHHAMGIHRLRMPSAAPSRSTLKLEEAIKLFFNKAQASALFTEGMRAVDLGACPGGWTHQLVARKLTVEAVDHGLIEQSLMQSGYVEHYSEDGFLYQPQQGNADWLVCDMIEQPSRVSKLMLDWLSSGKANACIFNLKLPMNKREKVVSPIIDTFNRVLSDRFDGHVLKCKHLYHNRDEVTVMILVNSQMLAAYNENLHKK